jgi:ankyrin repeat domain-containing protein 50
VKQTLQNFPLRIEDAYLQTWIRIMQLPARHMPIAKMALLWVVYAPRSMTVAELQHAVATDPKTFEFDRDELVPEVSLISLCCGLVTVDDESRLVRLVRE